MNFADARLHTGSPAPLGATALDGGVNFALYSAHAERIELCLFDATGEREVARLPLPERTGDIWHGHLAGAGAGLVYGYRAHGPYEPSRGHRFNPNKLLLDPYAKEITGGPTYHPAMLGYRRGDRARDLSFDSRDSARYAPKGRVVASLGPAPRGPRRALSDSVIYELHPRGYTLRHPGVPSSARGTFAALASEPILEHLTRLGVTAIEIMPIHPHIDEARLIARGLVNYWGYNSYNYFAVAPRFLSGGGREEARAAIEALHAAGIEVILDVVYNHTGEGDELGPTLSFRGLDNAVYYRLGHDPRFYVNDSGCGNSLNAGHPAVRAMIVDSLAYWADEMGVDGFRFDLATSLGREPHRFQGQAAIFDAIAMEPRLQGVKLIAEPWDVGPGGHRLGEFPLDWAEWNDRYRDTVRRFWRGDAAMVGDLATRIAGSSDVFRASGRTPAASVNYVTAHDGFTLRDLVTYSHKHNEANTEENRDGAEHNFSWNCGMEGTPASPEVETLRRRQARNLLATLLLSQGAPMLLGGDEFGRTQKGNNNAYCQDSAVSWVDWSPGNWDAALAGFVAKLIAFRARTPALRRRRFLEGAATGPRGVKDITWLNPSGREMRHEDWFDPELRLLGFRLSGDAESEPSPPHPDVLVLMNASAREAVFELPDLGPGVAWTAVIDTSLEDGDLGDWRDDVGDLIAIEARSLIVLEGWRI